MTTDDPIGEAKARDQFLETLLGLRSQLDAIAGSAASQSPSPEDVSKLAKLGGELDQLSRSYLEQLAAFAEQRRRMEEEEAARKKAMPEKRTPTAKRDDAQIQKLSEELSTGLRLDRVDAALKELLDFLGDAEFFAANASIGRKRRLRTLQNAIETALQK